MGKLMKESSLMENVMGTEYNIKKKIIYIWESGRIIRRKAKAL
jgi:hypothetical protein